MITIEKADILKGFINRLENLYIRQEAPVRYKVPKSSFHRILSVPNGKVLFQ
ncbi:hypothetical protein TNCV_1091391, partial [Trichonephila clavipes]